MNDLENGEKDAEQSDPAADAETKPDQDQPYQNFAQRIPAAFTERNQ